MPSPADLEERKLSRRRFIKRAGAFAAVGAATIALGDAVGGRQNLNAGKLAASPVKPATTTITETDAETATASVINPRLPLPASPPAAMSLLPPSNPSSLLAENPFSIFWITDTQFLSETNPALFKMLNNWIVNNWDAFNGKIVIHTGDLVQDGSVQQEWENADDAMSVLVTNNIPYTWCAGNHDDLVINQAPSGWMGNRATASLNPSIVKNMVNGLQHTRWVGDCHDGMNTAMTFFANNLNFLVVNIEWNAQPDILQWVAEILDDPTYSNHRVIIAPHAYINAYGSTDDPGWGYMLSDFIKGLTPMLNQHPNVFLTLNGHFATECGYNTPTPINSRNELMFDRQDCTDDPANPLGRGIDSSDPSTKDGDKVGGATATVLTFDTYNNQIKARTYDIYPSKWREDPFEQYTITMFPKLALKEASGVMAQ